VEVNGLYYHLTLRLSTKQFFLNPIKRLDKYALITDKKKKCTYHVFGIAWLELSLIELILKELILIKSKFNIN